MTRRRVTVVTAGHLATCPRMVKAADALHAAGYDVRVISTRQTPWATAADRHLHARRGWRWEVVAHDRAASSWQWLKTGLRFRGAHALADVLGRSCPSRLWGPALSRVHAELVRAILREPRDLIYGGTSGALAAVTEAARRSGVPYAVDFEDFHCGEHAADRAGSRQNELAGRVMADAVAEACFVTAGSAAIGRACADRFGVSPISIHNVFPLPAAPDGAEHTGPLRLYWFSQTIGPQRGLEDVVNAAGAARLDGEFHLRGMPAPGYLPVLRQLAEETAPALRIVHHAPDEPDAMVDGCRAFDIGLSVEQGHTINNALSLSNKALTYPLAGLALAITDTPGQRPLANDLGEDAVVYRPGDVDTLARGLAGWNRDRAALRRAKLAAWAAARRRWHWDHPLERHTLLAAVAAAA